jgi:hypothetical protein
MLTRSICFCFQNIIKFNTRNLVPSGVWVFTKPWWCVQLGCLMAGLLSSQVIKCTDGEREGEGRLLHLNTTVTEFLPCSGRQEGARYEIGVNESGRSCLCTSLPLSFAWDRVHIVFGTLGLQECWTDLNLLFFNNMFNFLGLCGTRFPFIYPEPHWYYS